MKNGNNPPPSELENAGDGKMEIGVDNWFFSIEKKWDFF